MQLLLYYISLPFIYLISVLPFGMLYVVSDMLNLVLFGVIGYRKNVVLTNLKNAFPKKNDNEIISIYRKFRRHFCDVTLESVKTLTMSNAMVKKRIRFDENEPLARYAAHQRSVILISGHYGNWEWAGVRFALLPYYTMYAIYKPLANKHFDRLINHARGRTGMKLYQFKRTYTGMLRNRDKVTATAFITDQTPRPSNAYWTNFLNQDTPVYRGTEVLAIKFNYPVIYVSMQRQKRGFYTVHFETLVDSPVQTSQGEITERHTRRLEQDIKEHPEFWLWTHRRWKHRRVGSS